MKRETVKIGNPLVLSRDELQRRLVSTASMIKLVTGVANNCAIQLMLDALSEISGKALDKDGNRKPRHPAYQHRVKQLYHQAIKEWHDYENRLLHASTNRFFCMKDMSEKTRKIYGDITDAQYFEFWKGIAGPAYQKTRPLMTSLWNKYRVSMVNHGVKHADQLAWVMTATSGLQIALMLYEQAIKDGIEEKNIPKDIMLNVFKGFSLARVATAWTNAMKATDPSALYPLDETEDRNIELGILQLAEAWASPSTMYRSCMDTIPDYDDIFRTKGEMKKAMRNIQEVEADTELELEKK